MSKDFQLIVFTEYQGWREELYLSLSGNGQFTLRQSPLRCEDRNFIRSRIPADALKNVKEWLMEFDDSRENRSIHFTEKGRDFCLLVITRPSPDLNESRNPFPVTDIAYRYRQLRNRIATLTEMVTV